MSLQDLGSIGERIAAVATIATLAYLAVQVRQNTRAPKNAAHQDTTRGASDFAARIGENGEVARIFRIGLLDSRELDEDERMRFSMLFNFQNLRSLYRDRNVEVEFWVSPRRVMLWYMEQPGVRHRWSGNKDRLNRVYVGHLDQETAAS